MEDEINEMVRLLEESVNAWEVMLLLGMIFMKKEESEE